MFGYVKTDMPNMFVKDTVLYKAMYCGLCKGIGIVCGTKGRLLLNYDLTFLSLLVHNLLNVDVKIEKQRCIIHHIKKRPVAVPDKVTERIGALNVILAYHKLNDDVIDAGKGKFRRVVFLSAYKKAKKSEPVLDKIVEKHYKDLLAYEKAKGDSIDLSADPFATMMQGIMKWIYLVDAIDDFDKDKKKNNFNVFINSYPEISSKDNLMREKGSEIIFVFGTVLSTIKNLVNKLNFKFNHDLIDNILLRGLPMQTKQVMENKKWKNIMKF